MDSFELIDFENHSISIESFGQTLWSWNTIMYHSLPFAPRRNSGESCEMALHCSYCIPRTESYGGWTVVCRICRVIQAQRTLFAALGEAPRPSTGQHRRREIAAIGSHFVIGIRH